MPSSITYLEATKLHKKGLLEEAIALYEKTINQDKNNITAIISLGNAFYDNQEYEKALKTYIKADEKAPNTIEIIINLGDTLNKLGKHEEAIQTYKKALEIDASSKIAILSIANSFYDLSRFDEAIFYYKKGIENYPLSVEFLLCLGDAYLAKDEKEKALETYKKICKIEPDFPESYAKIATILDSYEEHDEAITYYDKLLKLSPQSYEFLIDKGLALLKLGQKASSFNLFEQVSNIKKDDAITQINLGKIYYKQQQFKKALQSFSYAIEADNNNIQAKYLLYKSLISWAEQGYKIQAINMAKGWVGFFPNCFFAKISLDFLKKSNQLEFITKEFRAQRDKDNDFSKSRDKSFEILESLIDKYLEKNNQLNILQVGYNKKLSKIIKNNSLNPTLLEEQEEKKKLVEDENSYQEIISKSFIDFSNETKKSFDVIFLNETYDSYKNLDEIVKICDKLINENGLIFFTARRSEEKSSSSIDKAGHFYHNKDEIMKSFKNFDFDIIFDKTNIAYWQKNTPIFVIFGVAKKT